MQWLFYHHHHPKASSYPAYRRLRPLRSHVGVRENGHNKGDLDFQTCVRDMCVYELARIICPFSSARNNNLSSICCPSHSPACWLLVEVDGARSRSTKPEEGCCCTYERDSDGLGEVARGEVGPPGTGPRRSCYSDTGMLAMPLSKV